MSHPPNQTQGSAASQNAADPTGFVKRLTVIGAVAAGVGLVGFLVGISENVEPARAATATTTAGPTTLSVAPSYSTMAVTMNIGIPSDFAALKQNRSQLFDPVDRNPEMKNVALADRLRTRAFDAAPPVVPHPIEQQTYVNCLLCHADGMTLGGLIATKISHPHYASCTQCHVEADADPPFARSFLDRPPLPNEFAGRLRAGPGDRAYPGAPPTIPHATHMRTDCMSCHGLVARPGLRTTHPWLQNCVQCHVPSAEQDEYPGSDFQNTAAVSSYSKQASPAGRASAALEVGQP